VVLARPGKILNAELILDRKNQPATRTQARPCHSQQHRRSFSWHGASVDGGRVLEHTNQEDSLKGTIKPVLPN
jgi:hypothetical protein